MIMDYSAFKLFMKNGTLFTVQQCLDATTSRTKAYFKDQIVNGIANMSRESIYQRFASPIHRLSENMLEHLTSMDGKDHVAWAAFVNSVKGERGIGVARYVKIAEEKNMAEFAITVIDEFQKQGVGYQLLSKLIEAAKSNQFEILRGYILQGNKQMLSLCKQFNAKIRFDDPYYIRADINVLEQSR